MKDLIGELKKKEYQMNSKMDLLLYAIYTKDLSKNKEDGMQMLQFADDIVIYNTGKGEKNKKKIRKSDKDGG